jgi:hypothetical protein
MPDVIVATDEDQQSPHYSLWDYMLISGRKVVNRDSQMWRDGRRVPLVHNDICPTIQKSPDTLPHLPEAESERLYAEEIERRRSGRAQWDWCLVCARKLLTIEEVRRRAEVERVAEARARMAADPEDVRATRQVRAEARMRARRAERGWLSESDHWGVDPDNGVEP